jgi:tRNA U55 pseudouridine synthase TruB
MELPRYVLLDKAVGQTPLQCMETWRAAEGIDPSIPLTYAGRLDPMASGKLLVLIGEECKNKDRYLALDKTYEFSVLLGIGSDTHDVLGRLQTKLPLKETPSSEAALQAAKPSLTTSEDDVTYETRTVIQCNKDQLKQIAADLVGDIELPYPHFSSKTVQGKPLHMWTLEGRLDEIEIPTKASTIYSLELDTIETLSRADVCSQARAKIDTIPEVTEDRKILGNDFRRADIRKDWNDIKHDDSLPTEYSIAHFTCSASSGTYMRTLAKLIGERLDPVVSSLAWSIHRTEIKNIV